MILKGIQLKLTSLQVRTTAARAVPHLRGALKGTVRKFILGQIELSQIVLDGALSGDRLEIAQLTAQLSDGQLNLKGSIGVGNEKEGPGPILLAGDLRGRVLGAPHAVLQGDITLEGPQLAKLKLSGQLTPLAQGSRSLPRRGANKHAPPLVLQLQIGQKRLRGSLKQWVLR
jgi:hypothetical protein